MNVTIIYHSGLTESSKAFYREFARQGVRVSVIVPKKVKLEPVYVKNGFLTVSERDFEPNFNLIPVDLINIHKYNLGFRPLQLHRALKITKPDIIHVLNEYTGFHVAQAIFSRNILYGRKTVVVAYTFENIPFKPYFLNFSLKSLCNIACKIYYPFIAAYNSRYIDGVTGTSTEAMENVRKFNSRIPTKLIFWGVDFNKFYPKDRNLCRKKLGIPEDVKLIGHIGRIIQEKGLDKLCEAISKIKKYHLLLVGNGDYESKLSKIINSLGLRDRVFWYNSVTEGELVDYYNCLDIFVLPSQTTPCWKEQYGRVLVEAMACDLPIIGSSSGVIPEILQGYCKHLIFKEDSVIDLINKIDKIAELKSPEDFNLKQFLYKFSVNNFVSKHIEFYETLLRDRK